MAFVPRFALRFIRPDPRGRVTDPVGDVVAFIHSFEEKYGQPHPVFYQGTYSQVSAYIWMIEIYFCFPGLMLKQSTKLPSVILIRVGTERCQKGAPLPTSVPSRGRSSRHWRVLPVYFYFYAPSTSNRLVLPGICAVQLLVYKYMCLVFAACWNRTSSLLLMMYITFYVYWAIDIKNMFLCCWSVTF